MATEGFGRYYRRVFAQIRTDAGRRLEWAVIAVTVATIGVFLYKVFGLIPTGQVSLRILLAAVSVAMVLLCYLGSYAVRAPWRMHNSLLQERASILEALAGVREKLAAEQEQVRDAERRLADNGPQIRLEWEKAIDNPRGGLLLTSDKNVAELRIQSVSRSDFFLTFDPRRSIRPNEPLRISASTRDASGTNRDVLYEFFALFSEPLPLEIEYWDMRGNRFTVRWYLEKLELEGWDGPELHYALRQDPGSYRYIPATQAGPPDPTPAW